MTSPLQDLMKLSVPIVQGPFGGGLSSVELTSAVSAGGGLGSFGAHHLGGDGIREVAAAIRQSTDRPFALNLWVSSHDLPEEEFTRFRFDRHVRALRPLYDEYGVEPPAYGPPWVPSWDEQIEAVLEVAPPVFSFVFGIPDPAILDECRRRGILTVGTAITPEEAVALDEAGVDAIVATGFEAGGHRVAFLDEAERSLFGTMALIPIVADEVDVPVIAAGGITDARGVAAAFALGADGVQVGTAFLATDESNAPAPHRALLRDPGLRRTQLTRSFSGRLARGFANRLMEELPDVPDAIAPYPYQGKLLAPVRAAAGERGDLERMQLWSGQAVPLVRHTRAADVLQGLAAGLPAG